MAHGNTQQHDNYGISRIDDDTRRTHAWRVSLRRHGRTHVKNFTDRKYGGSERALEKARRFRDELLKKYPPITRREVCAIERSNNKSGITGVCTYAKRHVRRDGSVKENWYWEASWPTTEGNSARAVFSVNTYGQEMARQMAIRARQLGLEGVDGVFWRSARGVMEAAQAAEPGLELADSYVA